MNCKKAISEEVEIVKQLDAQLKSLKEAPGTRRSSSPPIRSNKSFVFQPLDEYPTSSPAPFDDPDVWAPPRDTPTRRPTRGQSSARKSSQDGAWTRGSSRTAPSRSTKPNGSKGGSAVKSSNSSSSSVRKGKPSSSKADSVVIYIKQVFACPNLLFQKICCVFVLISIMHIGMGDSN